MQAKKTIIFIIPKRNKNKMPAPMTINTFDVDHLLESICIIVSKNSVYLFVSHLVFFRELAKRVLSTWSCISNRHRGAFDDIGDILCCLR